jgi:hypothetical protein
MLVIFNRPSSSIPSSYGEDDDIEVPASTAIVASEEASQNKVAINPANVVAVVASSHPDECFIRLNDGRKGFKIVGSFDEVVGQLSA